MTTRSAIDVASTLKDHLNTVTPGKPFRLHGGHGFGEGVWQGDLGIEIVERVPDDYIEVEHPTEADRQLVPEAGQGSHHRVRSLKGVRLFRPKDWGGSDTDLRGPCVIFDGPNEIVHEPGHDHPHGTVVIDAPMTVLCRYQRNLDAEQQARRAAD